jgi:hypothetical protein
MTNKETSKAGRKPADFLTQRRSAAKPQPKSMEGGGWRMEKSRFARAQKIFARMRDV